MAEKTSKFYFWVVSVCGKAIIEEDKDGFFTFCGDEEKYTLEQIKVMFPVGRLEPVIEPSF
jgi:hypothetical protein